MNRLAFGFPLVVGTGVFLLATASFQAKPNAKAFGWMTDLKKAKALAKQTGKPMFITFRCVP